MNTPRLVPWNWLRKEEVAGNAPARMARRASAAAPVYMELDQLFESLFNGYMPYGSKTEKQLEQAMIRPSLDVSGNEKQYKVTVELPGVDEKDLQVELDNDTLRIHGEKKFEQQEGEEGKGYYRMERSYGSFHRVLALPKDADSSAITAEHKDGVLTITIPRKTETLPESRKIAIGK